MPLKDDEIAIADVQSNQEKAPIHPPRGMTWAELAKRTGFPARTTAKQKSRHLRQPGTTTSRMATSRMATLPRRNVIGMTRTTNRFELLKADVVTKLN
jgi:hypothetical protein